MYHDILTTFPSPSPSPLSASSSSSPSPGAVTGNNTHNSNQSTHPIDTNKKQEIISFDYDDVPDPEAITSSSRPPPSPPSPSLSPSYHPITLPLPLNLLPSSSYHTYPPFSSETQPLEGFTLPLTTPTYYPYHTYLL